MTEASNSPLDYDSKSTSQKRKTTRCLTSLRTKQTPIVPDEKHHVFTTPDWAKRNGQKDNGGQFLEMRSPMSWCRHLMRDILLHSNSHGGRVRKRQKGTERSQPPPSVGSHSSSNDIESFIPPSWPDHLSLGPIS